MGRFVNLKCPHIFPGEWWIKQDHESNMWSWIIIVSHSVRSERITLENRSGPLRITPHWRTHAPRLIMPYSTRYRLTLNIQTREQCLLLPFVPSTVPGGCACGTLEGGWPGHARLFQPGPVARVHGVGALYVRVMVAISIGVAAVFDPDRSPRLSPEVLRRRLQGRLSFPRHREREGQALLRARWHFHYSANQKELFT